MTKKQLKVNLAYEKDTPGTHRYKALQPMQPVHTLYIAKGAFGSGEPPKRLTLIVEAK